MEYLYIHVAVAPQTQIFSDFYAKFNFQDLAAIIHVLYNKIE